jgi:hypothetical protein
LDSRTVSLRSFCFRFLLFHDSESEKERVSDGLRFWFNGQSPKEIC